MNKEAPDNQTKTLRLLSYNILAGQKINSYRDYFTRSWVSLLPTRAKQNNLHAIASIFSEFDIVGLQEADAGSLRSGFVNQTRFLAEVAGMPYWSDQPNRSIGRLAHTANGLISRLEPTTVVDHPLPGRIPGRGILLATFNMGMENTSLTVGIAHLSLGTAARTRQLDFIAELIAPCEHMVLMGDFNTPLHSPEMNKLFRRTQLVPPDQTQLTFPSWEPQRAIDHILLSEHLTFKNVRTLPSGDSDHLPLAAEISIPNRFNPQPVNHYTQA